jgi:hypothetical protein
MGVYLAPVVVVVLGDSILKGFRQQVIGFRIWLFLCIFLFIGTLN